MADTKISALPASTTPLAGTEVLPIVQGGATRQVSVANLTTGRALSATQLTLTTGNLIVASGQGIDFSATPGTGTSELLNDYEEGTWTPVVTSWSTPPTIASAVYTKIGREVTLRIIGIGGVCANLSSIGGIPFTPSASNASSTLCLRDTTSIVFYSFMFNGPLFVSVANIAPGAYWAFNISYMV